MAENTDILDGLEDRLYNNAKAFESLLALTPAREYYGSQIDDGRDPSEQWNRKKQTTEEKRAAKKAKLDPANQKTALDVIKEREKKRKRELGLDGEAEDEAEDKDEGAGEKQEAAVAAPPKKRKVEVQTEEEDEAIRKAKAEKRREKRQAKKDKMAEKKERKEAKKAAKEEQDLAEAQAEKSQPEKPEKAGKSDRAGKRQTEKQGPKKPRVEAEENHEDDGEAVEAEQPTAVEHDAGLGTFDASGLAEDDVEDDGDQVSGVSSVPTSPMVDSPAFDIDPNHSAASSSSSVIPPSDSEQPQGILHAQKPLPKFTVDTDASFAPTSTKPSDPTSGTSSPKIQLPNVDQAQLQERLRQRIEELRARRKADGPEGKPAKSRQDLLEQRRKKDEQRKATKKELRRKAKEEEQRKREEQLRGSGSPMSMDMFSPRTEKPPENNFSFSRLAFEDGTAADPSLTGLNDPKKKKGPQDARTALEAAQKKQQRVSGYDAEKRADIADKDMWLNAKKRAHGERIRDDTSLLKKALKRKEKQKSKSEKQWQERGEAVVKGREMKQKKRETNLAKRKEEKGGSKGKKKGGQKGGAGKKKARAGFEGRFKA